VIRGRYGIEEILGQGSFGTVYKACDHQTNRPVALKMASPEPGTNPDQVKQQFIREAHVLASLKHPGICAIFDYFELGSNLWLVMELIPGQDLEEWRAAQGAPLTEEQLQSIASASLKILSYLHSQDPPIVHRDLKPANFRITPDSRLVLVDFGIARPRSPGQSDTLIIGTEGYAAPEQYRGYSQPASDLYAWSATMNWLATGIAPQPGNPPFPSLKVKRPDISEVFSACLDQCIALNPDERLSASAARELLQAEEFELVPVHQMTGCPHCGASAPVSVLQCCVSCHLGRDLAGATASEWAERGMELDRQNLWVQGLAHLQRARSSGHSGPAALLALGRCLARTNNTDAALAVFQTMAGEPRVLVEQAKILVERKDKNGALALLRGSNSPLTSGFYAGLSQRIEVLERLCKMHPGEPLLTLLLSRLLERRDMGAALAVLDEFLLLDPYAADVQRGRIRLLLAQERFKDCWVAVHALRRLVPHDPLIFRTLAQLYGIENSWGQALSAIQSYLSVRPDDLEAQFDLGAIFEKAGRSGEAIAVWRSLAGGVRSREGRKELMRVLVAVGQVAEAIGIGEVLVGEVEDHEVFVIYARALELAGRSDLAKKWNLLAAEKSPPPVRNKDVQKSIPTVTSGIAAKGSKSLASPATEEPALRRAIVNLFMSLILADGLVKKSETSAMMTYFIRNMSMDNELLSEIHRFVGEAQELEPSELLRESSVTLKSQISTMREELYSTCVEIAFADDELDEVESELLSEIAAEFQISATYRNSQLEIYKRQSDARLAEYEARREGRYAQANRVEFSEG